MNRRIRLYSGVVAVVGCIIFAGGSGCGNKGGSAPSVPPWAKSFGSPFTDIAFSAQQTTDGGYIAAGFIFSGALNTDAWVFKLGGDGSVAWQKAYGGPTYEFGYTIRQTADAGYVVAGSTYSIGAGDDMWVLKLTGDGSAAWGKAYGGSFTDNVQGIQQTTDGGYIVAGNTESFGAGLRDMWVLKLNTDGSVAWQKAYGGPGFDTASSIQQTADGGYIVAGNTYSFGAGNGDAWILKLNTDGSVAWQKTYGGALGDYAYSIQQTTDGGYIAAGGTTSFGAGSGDFWVLKLNTDGSVAWQKAYGGLSDDYASFVEQTTDGGYIVSGYTASFGAGMHDFWVLKLTADGSVTWQKAYGGTGDDYAISIQQTTDGGYIVAGRTFSFGAGGSDMWFMKLPMDGSIAFASASGAHVTDTTASVTTTVIAGQATSVSPSNTSVVAVSTPVTVTDTNAIVTQQAP